MEHNSVVAGHPKSTGILRVNEVINGSPGFGVSQLIVTMDL